MQQKVASCRLRGDAGISRRRWVSLSPAGIPRPWAPRRRGRVAGLSLARHRQRRLREPCEEPPLDAGALG